MTFGTMMIKNIENPHALLTELMRRDFTVFLRKAFAWISGGQPIRWNWHLDAIAYQLERVEHGHSRRLLTTLPPRSGKSKMISVAWVAWMLGRHPTHNFVCVSYSHDLAGKLARDCLSIIESPWYREIFPSAAISAKRSASGDFETTAGGGRLATSVTGTLTGRGGDIIILDDVLKPEEANSQVMRESVNNWYRSTLASRLDDKAKGAIICVMQRLHQNDLAGNLIETRDYDHLCLPAVATGDETIPLPRGQEYLRRAGDILHPAREPAAVLDRLRAELGSIAFSAQYQQDPVPAHGNFVDPAWFAQFEEPPVGGLVVQSWDTASKTGVTNDYSVAITALYHRKRYYILDVFRGRVGFTELRERLVASCRHHAVERLLIEDAASGTQLLQLLRSDLPRGVPWPVACKPEGDKISRFAAQASRIEAGEVVLPREASWLGDFVAEICGFPNSRHDDQPDALAQLLRHTNRFDDSDFEVTGPILVTADAGDDGHDWGESWFQ